MPRVDLEERQDLGLRNRTRKSCSALSDTDKSREAQHQRLWAAPRMTFVRQQVLDARAVLSRSRRVSLYPRRIRSRVALRESV